MPDSKRGDQGFVCSDCGEIGFTFEHQKELVPRGKTGSFCGFCWRERQKRYEKRLDPLPLGVQPPGIPEEFANHALEVTTVNKSVYRLDLTGEKNERIVSRIEKSLSFTKARAMYLKIGKGIVLKPRDGDNNLDLLFTSPVVEIKRI